MRLTRPVGGRGQAPQAVEQAIRGPGQPLPADLLAAIQPTVGVDLGRVRVHTDGRAAAAAASVHAAAFTAGRHIVFAAGRWQPLRPSGCALLLHELAHVDEQRAAEPAGRPLQLVEDASAERAADAPRSRLSHRPERSPCVQRRDDARERISAETEAQALRVLEARTEQARLAALDDDRARRVAAQLREAAAARDAPRVLTLLRGLGPGQRRLLVDRNPDLWRLLGLWMERPPQLAAHALLAGVAEQGPHVVLARYLLHTDLREAWRYVRDLDVTLRDRVAGDYDAAFGGIELEASRRTLHPLAEHLVRARRLNYSADHGAGPTLFPFSRAAAIAAALDANWQLGELGATAVFVELLARETTTVVQTFVRTWRRGTVYGPLSRLIQAWEDRFFSGRGWRSQELAALRGTVPSLRKSLAQALSQDESSQIVGMWTQFDAEEVERSLADAPLGVLLTTLRDYLVPGRDRERRAWLSHLSALRREALVDLYYTGARELPSSTLGRHYNLSSSAPFSEDLLTALVYLAGGRLSDPGARFGVLLHHFVDIAAAEELLRQINPGVVTHAFLKSNYAAAFGAIAGGTGGPNTHPIVAHTRSRFDYRNPDWRVARLLRLVERGLTPAEELYFELVGRKPDDALRRVNTALRAGLDAFNTLYNDWQRTIRVVVPPNDYPLDPRTMWAVLREGLGERFPYVEQVWSRLRRQQEQGQRGGMPSPEEILDELRAAYVARVPAFLLDDLAIELGKAIALTERLRGPDAARQERIRIDTTIFPWREPERSRVREFIESRGENRNSRAAARVDASDAEGARTLLKTVTAAWAEGDIADLRLRLRDTRVFPIRPVTSLWLRLLRVMLSNLSRTRVAADRLYIELFDRGTFESGPEGLASAADFLDQVPRDIIPALPPLLHNLIPDERLRGAPPGGLLDQVLWVIFREYPELSRDRLRLEAGLRGTARTFHEARIRAAQGIASGRQSRLYNDTRNGETPGSGRAPTRAAEFQLVLIEELADEERRDPEALRRRLETLYGQDEAAKLTDVLLREMIALLNEAAASRAALAEFYAVAAESLLRLAFVALLGPAGIGGAVAAWIATAGSIAVREFLLGVDHDGFATAYRSLFTADIARAIYANSAIDLKFAAGLAKFLNVTSVGEAAAGRAGLVEVFKFVTQEGLETLFERAVNENIKLDIDLVAGKAISALFQGVLAFGDRSLFQNADFINVFEPRIESSLRQVAQVFAFGVPSKASWPRVFANELITLYRNDNLTLDAAVTRGLDVTWRTLFLSFGAGTGTSIYRRWEGRRGLAITTPGSEDLQKISAADATIRAGKTPQAQALKEFLDGRGVTPDSPTRYIAAGLAANDPAFRPIGLAFHVTLANTAFGAADPGVRRGLQDLGFLPPNRPPPPPRPPPPVSTVPAARALARVLREEPNITRSREPIPLVARAPGREPVSPPPRQVGLLPRRPLDRPTHPASGTVARALVQVLSGDPNVPGRPPIPRVSPAPPRGAPVPPGDLPRPATPLRQDLAARVHQRNAAVLRQRPAEPPPLVPANPGAAPPPDPEE